MVSPSDLGQGNQKSVIRPMTGSFVLDKVKSRLLGAIQSANSSGHFSFLQIFDKAEASRGISFAVAHDDLTKITVSRERAIQ